VRGILLVALRLLWANPGRLVVLLAGAISVALAASGILLAATTSLAIVHQTVDAGWRGTYDLLVRPAGAPSITVEAGEVVPLDYLGLRTSGITREQWQRIAQLPDVEIAAPVAALGWLKNIAPGIGVELADIEPDRVYHVAVRAQIGGEDALHLSGLLSIPSDDDEVDVGFRDYSGPDPVTLGLGDLPATWALVVGIDPGAEDALIGLREFVDGRYLSTGTYSTFDQIFNRSALAVPILTASRSPVPGDLEVSVSAIDGITAEQVRQLYESTRALSRDELEGAISDLVAKGVAKPISSDRAKLADLLHPLTSAGILFDPSGHLSAPPENRGAGTAADDDLVLVPSLTAYGPGDGRSTDLNLPSLGSWQDVMGPPLADVRPEGWIPPIATFGGDSAVYRQLTVTTPRPFVLAPLGKYDREAIQREFAAAANYAPLGIYAGIPRSLVVDDQAVSVDRELPFSINPAGINPLPPLGLTNLEAVEALRGERFIDAVRVRVGGISEYTPEAVGRLEKVVQQIVAATGLDVRVIAGSSPVDLHVSLPGVGILSERWTTLGTAAEITSGAQGTSAAFLAAALGVVLTYLATFGAFLVGDQSREFEILRDLGWRRRTVSLTIAAQAVGLGFLAALVTIVIVTLVAIPGGRHVELGVLSAVAALVLIAHPTVAAIASFTGFERKRLTRGPGRGRPNPKLGLLGLAVAFVAESPGRAIVAAVASGLAITVAGVVAAVEIATAGQLQATFFGSAVAVRLAPYHFLAAAASLFGAGALILDGALLAVERRLPLIGVLRAVGWRSRTVRILVMLETCLPPLAAGAVAALCVGVISYGLGLGLLAPILGLAAMLLAVTLAIAATQLPAAVAARATPAATLRAEGTSGVVSAFAPQQALVAVAAIALTVSFVGAGWTAAQSAAVAPPPFVSPTEHPLPAEAARIYDDVAAIASYQDRLPGSISFDQGLRYAGKELAAAGYDVVYRTYLSPLPEYADAGGQPIEVEQVFSASIAYDVDRWGGHEARAPATFFDSTQRDLPTSCAVGIAILRVSDNTGVSLGPAFEKRCLGRTLATVTLRTASDEVWRHLVAQTATVTLPAGQFLTASSTVDGLHPPATFVASLDSRGAGAAQSAAPVAVLLEVARQLHLDRKAVRIGIASGSDGAAGSILVRELRRNPGGSLVWLGPMGATVAPVLGTKGPGSFDATASTAGLIWISPIDSSFEAWAELANDPSEAPTSEDLLDLLSETTGVQIGNEANENLGPLAAGFDAAWIGEPSDPGAGPPSTAGTAADTLEGIHPLDLLQLAAGLADAAGQLDQ
jgi:putative ABC transport system permease protein